MDGAVMRKSRMLTVLETMGTTKCYSIQELVLMVQRKFGYRHNTAEDIIRDMIRIGVLKHVKGDKYGANPMGFY